MGATRRTWSSSLWTRGTPPIEQTIANNASKVKGIVQPEKRGVERGTVRTISTSYTINKVFQVNFKDEI